MMYHIVTNTPQKSPADSSQSSGTQDNHLCILVLGYLADHLTWFTRCFHKYNIFDLQDRYELNTIIIIIYGHLCMHDDVIYNTYLEFFTFFLVLVNKIINFFPTVLSSKSVLVLIILLWQTLANLIQCSSSDYCLIITGTITACETLYWSLNNTNDGLLL